MNHATALVVGYPRTGFTLLISIIAEISNCTKSVRPSRHALKAFCDTAGMQIAEHIEQVFQRRGISNDLLYNYNFKQMVGGPKWLRDGSDDTVCFRKYIGVKGKGDFTLITSHPRQVLDYYEILHSHASPSRWAAHPAYTGHQRFASIRHPAGTLASACFSLNALASEYIQKFIPPEKDNDLHRQKLALYKLSDLNFFEALLSPFKAYLEEFSRCSDQYVTMRWEDLIQSPVDTILKIADAMDISLDRQQAVEIWRRIDHVNLTGAHKHNLRQGYGVVDGWKHWLTNTHLDMMRDYGLDVFSQEWGYGSIGTLDEAAYTPFQKQLAGAISNHEIIREYDDEDLFGFAFNKSNLDLNRFAFKRYDWRTHTQIERSTCTDDDLVMEVWDAAEAACEKINRSLGHWLDAVEVTGIAANGNLIKTMAAEVVPLIGDSAALSSWQDVMLKAMNHDMVQRSGRADSVIEQPSIQSSEPALLKSIGTTNIVEYSGKYYGLPQSLGPVDFHAQDVSQMPGVIVADSLAEIEPILSDDLNGSPISSLSTPLLFLHIPRTGGTSLINWLDGQFEKLYICPAHEMFEFEQLESRGQLSGYKFYRGHFGINLFLKLGGNQKTITFLRKPISRLHSTWSHLRNSFIPFAGHESSVMVQQIQSDAHLAHLLDFESFCYEIMSQGRLSFFNQMTVLLGLGRGWDVAKAGIPEVNDHLLNAAIENLDQFFYIGFTEHFNDDFERLSFLLTKEKAKALHLNSAPQAEVDFGEKFSAWLKVATRFDTQLYETALHRRDTHPNKYDAHA